MKLPPSIEPICPICHANLIEQTQQSLIECAGDDVHSFPVIDGIPILINDNNSVFACADYVDQSTNADTITDGMHASNQKMQKLGFMKKSYRKFALYLSEFSVKLDRLSSKDAIEYILENDASKQQKSLSILVVGAGDQSISFDNEDYQISITYTDVAPGAHVSVVCDVHDVPFNNASFDMVIASAVLEHVADPYRAVSEFHRILKDDGYIYANTPYMQPTHMGVYDFTRFSYNGYRRLFRWFSKEHLQISLGPASSLAYSIQYFMTSFSDHPQRQAVIRLLALIITRPLKYFDKILIKKKAARDSAAAFVFLGQKAKSPISDRALVKELSED